VLAISTAVLLIVLALSGCSSLLPRSKESTSSPWQSYKEAQLTFDKIVPGTTTRAELRGMHLDPETNPNITILNYAEVLRRFMLNQSVTLADLDRGVQECVSAKTSCLGYEVNQKLVKKHRNGNFWLDVLGFKRETHIEGFKFCGLVLIKDGVVVYKLTSGQPGIAESEATQNPLGPVQALSQRIFGFSTDR
jgi:uncharacterized protein YceK